MSRLLKTAALIGLIAGAVQAQAPVVQSMLSSASETLPGLPNSAIAQGSIFVVYGNNMGPTALAQYTGALPLPTTAGLGGTVVTVTGGGVTATAPLFYTSAGQLAGIMPSNIPVGSATVTVAFNVVNGTLPVTVVANNFSMFTINGSGTGPAVIVDAGNNNSVVTVNNSAQPGDVMVLYGTGLGPITGGTDAGVPVQTNLTTTIAVYVGGIQATVAYHGRSGDAGLDQINFTVPATLSGCAVPIIVVSGTGSTALSSNIATMAVAAARGTTCSDATSLPLSSITPNPNGTINFGGVSLSTNTSITPSIQGFGGGTMITAGGSASFYQYTAAQLVNGFGFSTPSIGGCVVDLFNLANSSTSVPTFVGLNAGNPISVTGPVPLTLNAVSGSTGSYTSQSLSAALPQGTYTVTGPGTSGTNTVGTFTTTMTVAQTLVWSNQAAISAAGVTRANGLQINWTGGAANSYVEIKGESFTSENGVAAEFICLAPVAASTFTVPAAVLLSLPPSVQIIAGFPSGSLSVSNYTNPAPISPTPTGLNYAYTQSGSSTSASVNYQ